MKRKSLLLLWLIAMMLAPRWATNAYGQMHTVAGYKTVGNESSTSTSYYAPVNNYYKYTYTQILYTASELGATSGTITSIGFQYAYSTAMTKKTNVEIYMGNTSKTSFSSTTDNVTSGLTLVYSGNLNCSQGWNEFSLSSGFSYSGGGLIVTILDKSGQYDGTSYTFTTTSTSDYMTKVWYSDSYSTTDYTSPNTSMSQSYYQYRPNTRFSFSATNYSVPVNNFYRYTYSQVLYKAAELGSTAGVITSIGYQYAYSSAMTAKTNVEIYLGNTSKTSFSSETDNVTSGLTLVYSGSLNCSQGWNDFELDTPFNYTGGGLIVTVLDKSNDYNGTSYVFATTATTDYMSKVWYSDSYSTTDYTSPNTSMSNKYRYQYRPNTRFAVYPKHYELPVNNWYRYTYSQVLYKAADLGGQAGLITSIGYQYAHTSAMTAKTNVEIYLGNTSKTSFSSETDNVTSGLTLVYSGNLNCSQGWNDFELDTPFDYTGGGLIVTILDMSNNYNGSAYVFATTPTTDYMSKSWYSDSYSTTDYTSPNTSMNNKSRYQYRPNTRFAVYPKHYELPVNNLYKYTYSQVLYTASDMGGSCGRITSIGYQYAYATAMTKKTNVEIYMGNTSKTSFSSETDNVTSGLTLVYSGNLNCSQGWNDFNLDTPFHYEGGGLIVTILDKSGQYDGSSYVFATTPTTDYMSKAWYSDYDSTTDYTSPNTSMSNKYRYQYRPNTRFTVTAPDPCADAIAMTSGQTYTGTLGICGIWDNYNDCSWDEPGEEHVYTFTPSFSGDFTFSAAEVDGDPDFFVMSSCGTSGTNYTENWNYGNRTLTLTAGTTYYFIVDNADDSQSCEYEISVVPNTHTLTASVNPANSGTISANGTTISGATTYNHGTSVQLTANAATGYTFQNWTIDGSTVSGASTTITMDQDHTVVANFTLNQYTVTLNVGTGGTATGSGTYNEGTTAYIEAFPDACHTFSHFIDDNNTPIYGFNPAPITVDHDMTITVVFEMRTYTINASASPSAGGTVTGGGTLDCGSSCTLTATPATNYVFDNWTENGTVVSSNASYNFTVNGDRTLVANFHLDAVNITATAYDDSNNTTGGGTISGTGSFNIGSTCTLVATPASGYHFVNWTENNLEVATTANYSFTVTTARDLVAHFTQDEYTLNLVADPVGGGMVSASPAGPYHYNDVVTVTATPNSGYIFGSWSDGGTAQHTVTITGNTSLTAYFGADQTLTTYANPIEGGYVTIAENQVSTIGAVEVGDASASGVQNVSSPYWTSSQYSFEECLYLASEIGVADAYITSISYYVRSSSSASSQTDDRIEVYMKNTNRTSFSSSNSDMEAVTANDKVFDGTWHLTNTTGWVTIVLDKPFHYTGSSLMIGINEMTQGASNINFKFTNTATLMSGGYSCRSRYSNDTPLDPTSLTSLPGQKINDRANVRLGFGTYHYGQSVTLTAHANDGYQFVNWTENSTEVGTHGNATYTVTMDADHTIYANFERLAKRFINDGNWNVAANWSDGAVPDLTEEVAIEAHAVIPSGVIGYADNIRPITHANGSITIQDGGQLIHNNASNNMVTVTVENTIASYDDGGENIHNKGYEIVSFPVENLTAGSNAITGAFTQDPYDFYRFDANADPLEWIHMTSTDNISLLQGFIYASQNGTTIRVTGPVMSSENDVNGTAVDFLNADAPRFNGWALLGNPFVCNAYVSLGTGEGAGETNFYKLNHTDDYDEFVPFSSGDAVTPMGGVMFRVYADDNIVYSRTAPNKGTGILNMDVNRASVRGTATLDRARVRFGEGRNLEKLQFDTRHTKIYIPEGGNDFSVYYADGAGTIPVNFKAQDNGRYTLDFSTEDVGFNYLHLIDNMNGNDVDLLQTPYYAFDAKSTDFASRFTLVFATGNDNDDTFAFFNNGVWIINNDGDATLQVVDALGRVLSSESISGSTSKAINVAPGVYMLRLINGNDVKVQKVVVRR